MSRGGVILLCMFAVLGGDAAGAEQAEPATLLQTSEEITALARGGSGLAWIASVTEEGLARCGSRAVFARRRAAAPVIRVGEETCESLEYLVMAGKRVFWRASSHGNSTYTSALTAVVGRRPVHLERPTYDTPGLIVNEEGFGSYVGVAAADADTIVYTTIHRSWEGCEVWPYGDCVRTVGGSLWRVDNSGKHRVPGAGGAAALSVAGGNVAAVPIEALDASGKGGPPPGLSITVRNVSTGRLINDFKPSGVPREVALTRTYVAVLVERGTRRRVEVRDLDGALLRSLPVPRRAEKLSASGDRIVYAVGPVIYSINARRFTISRVYRATSVPVGLSIVGERILWAETARGRSAVRALSLP